MSYLKILTYAVNSSVSWKHIVSLYSFTSSYREQILNECSTLTTLTHLEMKDRIFFSFDMLLFVILVQILSLILPLSNTLTFEPVLSSTVVSKVIAELELCGFQCLKAEVGGNGLEICYS